MITITKAADCSYVRLSSPEIDEHDDTYKLELSVTNQATGSSFSVPIEAADIIIVSSEERYFEQPMTNGIYSLSLIKTVGTTKTYRNDCLFLDCDIRCDAIGTDIETTMLHYALTLAEECACDCDKMKEIYELLLLKIEDNPCKTC